MKTLSHFLTVLLILVMLSSCSLTNGTVTERPTHELLDNKKLPKNAFIVVCNDDDYVHAYALKIEGDSIHFNYSSPGSRQINIARQMNSENFTLPNESFNETTMKKMVVVNTKHIAYHANRMATIHIDDITSVITGENLSRNVLSAYMFLGISTFITGLAWTWFFLVTNN